MAAAGHRRNRGGCCLGELAVSVRHLPDRPSPWLARVRTTGGREVTKAFTRKIDARAWVEDQRAAMRRGDWVDPRRGTIRWDEYAADVLATKSHLSPRTVETYQAANRRILPMLADVPLNQISPELLEQTVSKLISHP